MKQVYFSEPRPLRALLTDIRWSWIWVPLRLWLGWEWLEAGWGKFNNPAWMQTGGALKSFWERAVAIPETGRPAIAYDWYRGFLQSLLDGGHAVWFGKLVTFGEMAIGLALILGAFVGLAAFFGVFLNWHFVMAGAASTNAMLALVGVLLVLGWRTAGWIGLDRWLLALVRTPQHQAEPVYPDQAASGAYAHRTKRADGRPIV